MTRKEKIFYGICGGVMIINLVLVGMALGSYYTCTKAGGISVSGFNCILEKCLEDLTVCRGDNPNEYILMEKINITLPYG